MNRKLTVLQANYTIANIEMHKVNMEMDTNIRTNLNVQRVSCPLDNL